MKHRIYITSFLLSILYFPQLGIAQDSCGEILQAELYNTSKIINKDSAKIAIKTKACTSTYQEFQKNGGFEAGASYGIFSGDVKGSQSSFKKWQQSSCRGLDSSSSKSKYRYEALKSLAPDVVREWGKCMSNQKGLNCYFKPNFSNNGSAVLIVNWNVNSTQKTKIRRWQTENTTNEANNIFQKGEIIPQGEDQIIIKQSDLEKESKIILSILHGESGSHSCSAVLPKTADENYVDPKFPVWKKQILSGIAVTKKQIDEIDYSKFKTETQWAELARRNSGREDFYYKGCKGMKSNIDQFKNILEHAKTELKIIGNTEQDKNNFTKSMDKMSKDIRNRLSILSQCYQ